MYPFLTLFDLLKFQSQDHPGDPALFAPHKNPLSYQQLFDLINHTAQFLHGCGIRRSDPVAIVLPDGPEMAAAFLAVASCAAAAPLNPNYRASEFEFYFTDLQARALITLKGWDTPARQIASQSRLAVSASKNRPTIWYSPASRVQDTCSMVQAFTTW